MKRSKLNANPPQKKQTEYVITESSCRNTVVEVDETFRQNGSDIRRMKNTKSFRVIADNGSNLRRGIKLGHDKDLATPDITHVSAESSSLFTSSSTNDYQITSNTSTK